MKKIISILLSLIIMTTVVSSLAFANTTQTGLIDEYSGTLTAGSIGSYTVDKAEGETGIEGEYKYNSTKASKSFTPYIYLDTDLTNNPWPENAKFIKASFTLTPTVDFSTLKAAFRPKETDNKNSNLAYNLTSGTDYEITFLVDVEEKDVYFFIDGMLVTSRLECTYTDSTINGSNKLGFSIQCGTSSEIGATSADEPLSVFKISNAKQTAYDSTATLDTLGLYTCEATYTAGVGYAFSHSMIGGYGLKLCNTSEYPFVVYVAGYDVNDDFMFVNELNINQDAVTTISTEEEADKLKVFVWDSISLKPYIFVTPVKTNSN